MSLPAVSVQEPASEAPSGERRRALLEVLPTGAVRAAVAVTMLGCIVASFAKFGLTGHAVLGALFTPTLVLLAVIDAKHRLLPNAIVLPATLAVGIVVVTVAPGAFLGHLAVATAAGGFFFAFAAIFPGSFGMGDAKLVFMLGLALGGRTLGAIFVAFAALLVVALYVIAKRGPAARKETIPFGPFLALGGLVAFFLS